jgi:DNA (cytosine-5)-methyltransferase 1
VLARLQALPVNGTRFDLPAEHRLKCHDRLDKRNATSSYGRLSSDEPASTLTTRCATPACGRFVHPTEPRGLTLREAATLQTFQPDYAFRGTFGQIERQIGNAFPAHLAHGIALIAAGVLDAGIVEAAA